METINEIEKCDNCDEPLTDIEKAAKHEGNSIDWCCHECFDCESDEFTEHGKYIILLRFVKTLVRDYKNSKNAKELLEWIGEDD